MPEKAPERERDLVGSPAGVISLPPSLQHHAAQSLDVQFGGLGLGRDSPATSPRVDTSTAFSASFGLTSQGVQASEPAAQTDAPALSKPRDTQPQQAPGFPPTQPAAPQQQAQPQPQAQGQAQPYSYYGMQGSSNAMPSYYGYNHFAMASNTPSEGAQVRAPSAPLLPLSPPSLACVRVFLFGANVARRATHVAQRVMT